MTMTDALGRTMEDLVAAAEALARADEDMRRRLVEARRAAGMSQRDVAEALGVRQATVAGFERHDNDPRLSTLRRYALAVGATIEHRVGVPSREDRAAAAVDEV